MSAQADSQAQALQQRMQSDPNFRSQLVGLHQQYMALPAPLRNGPKGLAIRQQIESLTGLPNGLTPAGWTFGNNGDLVRDHSLRNTLIEAAVGVGGSYLGSLAASGAFAGGAGSAAGAGAGSTTAAGTGTAAGTTAAGTGTSSALATGIGASWKKAIIPFVEAAYSQYANNKAKNTLVDASKQNQQVNQQVRDQNVARLDPWAQTGMSANSTLRDLFGLGPAPSSGGTTGTPSTPNRSGAINPNASVQTMNGNGAINPNPTPQPPSGANGATLQSPQGIAEQQTQSSYVRMRAPNGTEKDVPPNEVDHWTQLGAQQVGAA